MEQAPSQHSSLELGGDQLFNSPLPSSPNVLPMGLLQSASAAWPAAP